MASDINAITQAFKPLLGATTPAGCTLGLSVVAAAHAGIALPAPPGGAANTPDSQPKQFELVNTSTTLTVTFAFGLTAAIALAGAVIPGDGTVGGYTVGPGQTRVVSVDGSPLFVSAIASGAGPTLCFITPGNGR